MIGVFFTVRYTINGDHNVSMDSWELGEITKNDPTITKNLIFLHLFLIFLEFVVKFRSASVLESAQHQ